MEMNRVEDEQAKFWHQHQQEVSRDPSRLKNPAFLKGQVKLLDALLEKLKSIKDPTPFEKASYQTMIATRDDLYKRAHPSKTKNFLRSAGRFTGKTTGNILKGTGKFVHSTNRAIGIFARHLPLLPRLLLQVPRPLIWAAGHILQGAGSLLNWTIDKLLPGKKPAQVPGIHQQGQQQKSWLRRQRAARQNQGHTQPKQQAPAQQPGQENKPPAPGKTTPPPGSPPEGPPLRPEQSNGKTTSGRYAHRERVFSTPNPHSPRLGK